MPITARLNEPVDIGIAAERLAGGATGRAPVFDGLLALHAATRAPPTSG